MKACCLGQEQLSPAQFATALRKGNMAYGLHIITIMGRSIYALQTPCSPRTSYAVAYSATGETWRSYNPDGKERYPWSDFRGSVKKIVTLENCYLIVEGAYDGHSEGAAKG
jgi:hypothetical protein